MHFRVVVLLLTLLGLSACTSKEEQLLKTIDAEVTKAEARLKNLKTALDEDRLRNAVLLETYAKQLKSKKPEYAELINQIALDATSKGPMYEQLAQRLFDVKYDKDKSPDKKLYSSNFERLNEVNLISEAASVAVYNDALSDPINVLADMSGGELPRVSAVRKEQEIAKNNSKDFGAGSQYIGNPHYGQWRTNSSGMSFWEWYGMYSLFSNIGGGRVYYDDWSRYRGYSYYHDRGRSRYTAPNTYRKQQERAQKTAKSFASKGKKFSSPYAKERKGARSLSRSSMTPPASKSSNYSSRSSYGSSSRRSSSSYSGSTRRGSSRTSRGLSRGK